MSRLLSEIKQHDEAAAAVLEGAELRTDSDIQTLTIEDLRKLFPGHENIKPRRTIFEIIHKQKPVDQVLKELKGFIPHESLRAALTKDGVLVDYLPILKDMKTQMNHVQSFLDAHICLLEEFSTNQPNQQSATCGPDPVSHYGQPGRRQQGAPGEVMSRLLSEIKQQSEAAAAALEEAELRTDSDIQMLTIEDLRELFPGHEKFQLRRTIFEIIHKQKPVDQVLKKLKGFIPHESLRDALTNEGVLVDYRPILKDMKTQMNHVQSFLDAHDSILEEFSTNQPDQQSDTSGPDPESHYGQPGRRQQGAPGASTSAKDGQVQSLNVQTEGSPKRARGESATSGPDPESHYGQPGRRQQGAPGPSTSATDDLMEPEAGPQGARAKLMYRMVVSGKTFDAHLKLMERVKNQVQLVERDQDHEITFVFCPICSRDASDVEAAMTDVKATDDPMDSDNGPTDGSSQRARGTSTSATHGPEESHNCQTDGGPQRATDSLPGGGTSDASGEMKPNTGQTGGDTQGSRYNPFGKKPVKQQQSSAKLKYRMVVSGKTFGAHLNLMEKVKDQVQIQLQPAGSNQDHDITFVFCPICSRVASDVEAAMTDVKDDKPVILVLMHHTREVKYTSSIKTWRDDNKVVLFVHVFFHETIQGLLTCEENNAAVSKIQNELLKCFIPRSIDSRGNPQGMGAGGLTGNTFGRGGGNYRGSDVDRRSSGRSNWSPGL